MSNHWDDAPTYPSDSAGGVRPAGFTPYPTGLDERTFTQRFPWAIPAGVLALALAVIIVMVVGLTGSPNGSTFNNPNTVAADLRTQSLKAGVNVDTVICVKAATAGRDQCAIALTDGTHFGLGVTVDPSGLRYVTDGAPS